MSLRALSAGLAALALFAAGCGEDDEPANTGSSTAPEATATAEAPATQTVPAKTAPEREEKPGREDEEPRQEEQPGGAGDEEPIRTDVRFTGVRGRVTPPVVNVPPFIGVRVHLRSEDRAKYGLDCDGRRVQVDREIETASTTVAGKRAGSIVSCRALGDHRGARIIFAAEPGP